MFDNRKMGKIIPIKLNETEGDEALYSLTFRMARSLLSMVEYLRWTNRHIAIPSDLLTHDDLNSWVDNLAERLMKEIDPLTDICETVDSCIISSLEDPESALSEALYNSVKDKILSDQNIINMIHNGVSPFPTAPLLNSSIVLDELWAQCVQLVEFTHARILALFADLELQFNAFEFATFAELIPGIGTVVDEAQVDVALDLVNYAQEIWVELYNGNWSEDPPPSLGTKYVLACKLFCNCKEDGVITIDRIVSSFQSCITSGTISLESIGEILQTIVGINDDNPNIVYITFTAIWGIARLSSFVASEPITSAILNALLRLAENDANSDWEIYCEDCNEPIGNREPVIASNWDPTHLGGTITGPDVNGFYTATTTFRSTQGDQAITIMDIEERDFVLEDITYSSPTQCQVLLLDDVLLILACDSFNHYTGQTIDEFTATWPNSAGTQTMTFRMVAPS